MINQLIEKLINRFLDDENDRYLHPYYTHLFTISTEMHYTVGKPKDMTDFLIVWGHILIYDMI